MQVAEAQSSAGMGVLKSNKLTNSPWRTGVWGVAGLVGV